MVQFVEGMHGERPYTTLEIPRLPKILAKIRVKNVSPFTVTGVDSIIILC